MNRFDDDQDLTYGQTVLILEKLPQARVRLLLWRDCLKLMWILANGHNRSYYRQAREN